MWQIFAIHVPGNSALFNFNNLIWNTSVIRVYLKNDSFKCGREKLITQQYILNATINLHENYQIQNLYFRFYISHVAYTLVWTDTRCQQNLLLASLISSYNFSFMNAGIHPERQKWPRCALHVYKLLVCIITPPNIL